MKNLQFSIDIKAPKEEVWKTLWNDSTYRKWSSAFMEGSYAVTDWNEGSKVLFLGPNGDGMSSIIEKKIPNELMSFKHMSEVKNKKEVTGDEKFQKWSGAHENYTLSQKGETTTLKVEIDVTEDYEEMFSDAFPKALQKVKEISEKSKVVVEAV
jgi:hypothetical protein